MPKTLVVDQIEVTKTGTVQVRFHKISSDGDLIENHRTAIEPGGDVEAQMRAVSNHMETEGCSPLTSDDVAKVKAQALSAWTPANIPPVTAEVLALIQAQRDAEAEHTKAIADAEAAKAASEAAQAAAKAAADAMEAEKARLATLQAEKDAADKAAADKAAQDAAAKAQADAAIAAAQAEADKAAAAQKAFDDAVAAKVAELTAQPTTQGA